MEQTTEVTLTEFLLDRIAEREAWACDRDARVRDLAYALLMEFGWRDADDLPKQMQSAIGNYVVPAGHVLDGLEDPGDLEDRPGWALSGVLAKCEAERRIVEYAEATSECTMHGVARRLACAECAAADKVVGYDARILELLALPYADHPDYRQEWKP